MCKRCLWVDVSKPDYVRYHDKEWGCPIFDDRTLFEYLTLESAQAGLSWYTILKKRTHYQRVFHDFAVEKVAKMDKSDVARLMNDSGIVRNRAKIEATINNANAFINIQKEFASFAYYQWQFVNYFPIVSNIHSKNDYRSTSEQSILFAKDLKARGFKFLGPTTVYAYMQACGMVNDHDDNCQSKQLIIESYQKIDFSKQAINRLS